MLTETPAQQPRTVREFVDGILDAAEQKARESKMPYVDMLIGLRKEMGTAGVINLIKKRCLAPYREGPGVFRDYLLCEMQRQYMTAVQAGATDLVG